MEKEEEGKKRDENGNNEEKENVDIYISMKCKDIFLPVK